MVLDAAKGIEPQTLKLFEVCRARNLPGAHVPQQVRPPGPRPARAARRDRGADRPPPDAGDLAGRHRRRLPRRDRPAQRRRSSASPAPPGAPRRPREEIVDADRAAAEEGAAWERRRGRGRPARRESAPTSTSSRSCAGESTPVFVGSALTNFGVRQLLDAIVDLAPAPPPRGRRRAASRAPAREPLLRLRVQGPGEHGPVPPRPHRLRPHLLGTLRARHDRDPRPDGQAVRHQVRDARCSAPSATRSRRPIPGDVVGLVNATDLRHRRHAVRGHRRRPLPRRSRRFAPELFATARPLDTGRAQAVPPGPRAARRGGRRAGAARPRPATRPRSWPPSARCSSRSSRHRLEQRVRRPDRAAAHRRTSSPAAPTWRRRPSSRASVGAGSWLAATGPSWPSSRVSTGCSASRATTRTGDWTRSSRAKPWRPSSNLFERSGRWSGHRDRSSRPHRAESCR